MAERRDHRSSDEIRRDIEGTRTELRETVDALERKLSLGQVVDEVWGRVGGRRAAGAAASNFGETVRDNPVPLALMGLGVAWLAVDRATGSSNVREVGEGTYARAEGRVGPYRGDDVRESSGPSSMDKAKRKASDAAESAKDKASAVAAKAKGMASSAKHKAGDARDSFESSADMKSGDGGSYSWYRGDESPGMSDRAEDAADRARHTAGRAREGAARRAEQARHGAARGAERARQGFRSALDDQPLALGAVAFGLGLASGLAAPTTRWEDRTMGGAADTVKDEARALAKDTAQDAKQVAASAASAAKEEAERQSGPVKDSVKDVSAEAKDAAKSVAAEAKDTAKEEMRNRDLDAEGMKGRAKTSRKRTEERLSD